MKHPRTVLLGLGCALAALLATTPFLAGTRLLRFPDIDRGRVVFTYAGDLWIANSAGGGVARRLTAHPGVELFARFSPDGQWVAFTGQYDGDEQVYVIPAAGGMPRQLTFYPARGPLPPRWGYDNQVHGWTPDGEAVLFRSMRSGWDLTDTQLFTVSIEGGLPAPLPMPESGAGDFSPEGDRIVYSPLVRDFRTWKRYTGGWAQDLFIFDLASHQLRQVTDDPRSDRDPMWIGDTVYFSSDRTGTLNLYAFDTRDGRTRQVTHSDRWDVRWPGSDNRGLIVYELNGELEVLDVATGTERRLDIEVPDDGLWMRPSRVSAADRIEDWELSPGGERALFVARGDVFTVPIENGPTRNLTRSSDAHDKWARWSPDGGRIAFISDRSGEEELWLVSQDGSGKPRQLSNLGGGMLYAPAWSPDGERLALSDKDGKLYVIDVDSGQGVEIADQPQGQVQDYTWSPHGGHLAFSLTADTGFNSLFVWSREDGKTRRITEDFFHESTPTWDPSGEYLYYLSDRQFAPQVASFEWNYAVDRETGIFALALREDVKHPFAPESDEVAVDKDKDKDKKKTKKDKKEDDDESEQRHDPIRIDFDDLSRRVARVPVDDDNYATLTAVEGRLVYVRTAPFYYGRQADTQPSLRTYSIEEREESVIAEQSNGFALSRDGKKVLVRQESGFKLYDLPSAGKEAKTVSTAGLMVDRIPRQEWRTIFNEVWRRYRDFFYVENMHGYDWDALHRQYEPLLAHVAHRSDLNYVIGEMIAELNVGHAYVSGGDYETPERPQSALPGADFELDEDAGRYRLTRIFGGHNEEPLYRAPLTEVGVDAREGDYVLAIQGTPLERGDNPYELLRHLADRPVTLTLNDEPSTSGAREVTYVPITNEDSLRYLDWVARNRQRVSQMSDSRVGYLHLPNMGAAGIYEFIKWFYPQIRKEGLVVDVRGNGGGNVSQMVIERLRRQLLGTRFARTFDAARTYPQWVFIGPMVCVLNEDSASDGDIFPHMFRQAGLGPLIGKRSWGGVVGITSHGPLLDGGDVRVPQFGTNAVDGSWVIEGHGVEPDIEVENHPAAVIAGQDPQLERAVQEVLRAMRDDPRGLPARPADPIKTP